MKKNYIMPKSLVVEINSEDVIATSPEQIDLAIEPTTPADESYKDGGDAKSRTGISNIDFDMDF